MKSKIRTEVEKILGAKEVANKTCFIDGWRTKKTYRMKFANTSKSLLTADKINKLKALPNVIEVGYIGDSSEIKNFRNYYDGVFVRFNCKPSTIAI